MPTITAGTVDTEAVLADEKVVDMAKAFRKLDPDTSQFMTILNKLPSVEAKREKVNWLEDELFPNLTALAASAASAASGTTATLTVTTGTGAYFRVGDIVRIPSMSGVAAEVSATATSTITVTYFGAVSASAASGGDVLIVGNASAQGADTGALKVTQRVLGYNYTQIFRHPFGFTGTDVEIETYGAPGDPASEMAKKAVEHKRALENSTFFGARKFTSSSPSSKGYMGGLQEFLSTNVFSSAGAIDLAYIDGKLQTIFQHGSMKKVIFAAPTPAAALSRLFATNWVRARPEDKVYGAKVNAFINGAYGASVPVIVKREWGTRAVSNNEMGSWMFVLDLDYVKLRPLRNRGTKLLRNRQGNGEDKVVHEYLTETSFEVSQEKVHGLIKGITAASS
jgi:hypothetical protein